MNRAHRGLALAGRSWRKASPWIGLAVFGATLWMLQDWMRAQRYHQLLAALAGISGPALWRAALLTTAGYATLIGYDLLAMRFIGRSMPRASVAATAFIANALGNNLGNTLVTGAAVRYWTYGALGLSAPEIGKVVLFCSLGFWLGFLLVCGTAFMAGPITLPPTLRWAGETSGPLGLVFLTVLLFYALLTVVSAHRALPYRIGTRRFRLPSPALTLGQIGVASVDLCLMVSVFYALLPANSGVEFAQCCAVFLAALVAGNASLVPGGMGVFESAIVLMLGSRITAPELVAALVAFRAIYFVAPLLLAGALLGLRSAAPLLPLVRERISASAISFVALTPQVLAAVVFFMGALLLFSGSTPAAVGRLEPLGLVLALPLIEASHFLASLAGAALVLLARGLQRRLDAAWLMALVLLSAGAVLSLAKGWDYEEAAVLGMAAAILLPARAQFHRKSSLLAEPFSPAWTAAVAMVLCACGWLVQFAHHHALEAGASWWEFALHSEASRSARAAVGAVSLAALVGLERLLRPARPAIAPPVPEDMERARPLVANAAQTYANLALRGDKALLFSAAQDAFLMYGRAGRSWVAMGDPVGSPEGASELLWRFHDLCDRYDGWCVFYEVRGERRADYAELGLALTPLGEQARVDLAGFDVDSPRHGGLRQSRARLLRKGFRFEIVPREAVAQLLPALAQVSAAWLATKTAHEKEFSNASFDAAYLTQFPVALVRNDQGIVAFANLWCGAGRQELSVDLMRHLPAAPNGTMDFLFTELMSWGRANQYRWFDLGMAPLAGLEAQPEAPLWSRIGTLLYRHGEHFYNFEGLRRFKTKFGPVWTPMYLASPGGAALPAILVDVAALMAGSLAGIVSKRGPSRAGHIMQIRGVSAQALRPHLR